jgi:two-component system cell cycle sensor histidine kinase/response regulator CckA
MPPEPSPHPDQSRLRTEEMLRHAHRVAKLGAYEREFPDGPVLWSPELRELLGVHASGLAGVQGWLDLMHPDDVSRVSEIIARGLATAEPYQYTCRVPVHGEERQMQVSADFLRDEDGAPWRLVGTVQDITEWERSRAALQRSDALRAAVVDSALDCVIVIDAQGIVVEWNPAAEATFGYSRDEAHGRDLAELIIPARDSTRHTAAIARRISTGHGNIIGRRVELSAMRRNGEVFPVELAVVAVPGESPLFAGYIRDITDRREAEEAARSAQERWRTLVEQIPAVTYLCRFDEPSTPLYISPQIEGLLGIAADEWSAGSDSWLDRVHPADRERVSSESRARFTQERGFACVYRVIDGDGEVRWIDERSSAIRDEEGRPHFLQGVMVDVTASRRREEELREAQRLESIGQLAGGIAHDFNNLLGIIQGYAELLQLDAPENARADIAEILKAADRAADLTRQLLLFSRSEPAEASVVDVSQVAREMQDMLARATGEHVGFELRLDDTPCLVRIPARHLEQILVNLTVNARDAMPAGGSLSVATVRTQDSVVLRVQDDGAGMTADVAARAFEPFFTTKERGRGTGLGLASVYGVVMQAGGHVELVSAPGAGTVVTIELPVANEAPLPRPAPDDAPIACAGETILVVEDEDGVRELTRRILADSGYAVICAENGLRAEELLREHDGPIDLLVSDVVMPGMSGPQVAARLTQLHPGLRVLFMSGHPADLLDHQGVADGSTQLLEKPFDTRRLLESVRAALASR